MERYEDKIEKALQYLKQPSKTDARGCAPIVYLVYQPEDAIILRNIVDTFLLKPITMGSMFIVYQWAI